MSQKLTESSVTNVEFLLQDAEQLPLGDKTFDDVRSDWIFQHLLNPDVVMAEVCRVARSKGIIFIADLDWQSLTINSSYPDTFKKYKHHLQGMINNPYSGSKLLQLFRSSNVNVIGMEAMTMMTTTLEEVRMFLLIDTVLSNAIDGGKLTEQERDLWIDDLVVKDEHGDFFASITGYFLTGQL